MAVTIVYLTTLSSPWRLALSAHGNNKADKLKAMIAAECAAELLNWSNGLRAFVRALIRL